MRRQRRPATPRASGVEGRVAPPAPRELQRGHFRVRDFENDVRAAEMFQARGIAQRAQEQHAAVLNRAQGGHADTGGRAVGRTGADRHSQSVAIGRG